MSRLYGISSGLNLISVVFGQVQYTYAFLSPAFCRFNSLPPSYFRRADVVVLVYDVIEEISFLNVKSWMKTIYVSTHCFFQSLSRCSSFP